MVFGREDKQRVPAEALVAEHERVAAFPPAPSRGDATRLGRPCERLQIENARIAANGRKVVVCLFIGSIML